MTKTKPYSILTCHNMLVEELITRDTPDRIALTYNSDNKAETLTTYYKDSENNYLPLNYMIFNYRDGEFSNVQSFDVEGFIKVEDINTDFPLVANMYYEVIDFSGNKYSVYIGEDLLIPDNSVIRDVAGFVRLQGINMPCMFAIRDIATLENNTEVNSLIELESDFDNAGSVIGLKTLYNNINYYGI